MKKKFNICQILLFSLIFFSGFTSFAQEFETPYDEICEETNYQEEICKYLYFSKAKILYEEKNYFESANELLKQRPYIQFLQDNEKEELIWFVKNFECGLYTCSNDIIEKIEIINDQLLPDTLILLKKLKKEQRYFELADLTLALAETRKFKNNNQVDYETAKLFNDANEYIKLEGLDKFHPARVIAQLQAYNNGHCHFTYAKKDKRCEQFDKSDISEEINYVKELTEIYSPEDFFEWSNVPFWTLLGALGTRNAESLNPDRAITDIIKKYLSVTAEAEHDWLIEEGEAEGLEYVINYMIEPNTENTIKFFEYYYKLYDEDSFDLYDSRLLNQINYTDILARSYRELNNFEKQVEYYGYFIDHLVEYYDIVGYEKSSKIFNGVTNSLFESIELAAKTQALTTYNSFDLGFEFQLYEGPHEIIPFKIDDQGAIQTCISKGLDQFITVDDKLQKKPSNCPYSFQAFPEIVINNISDDSYLNDWGIENGDILIAVNNWIIDQMKFDSLFTSDNLDIIVTDFLLGFMTTELYFLKSYDYEYYSNLTQEEKDYSYLNLRLVPFVHPVMNEHFSMPDDPNKFLESYNLQLPKIIEKINEQKIVPSETIQAAEIAFKAAQIIFINQASNSFEKMRSRNKLADSELKEKIKLLDQYNKEINILNRKILEEYDAGEERLTFENYGELIQSKTKSLNKLYQNTPELMNISETKKKKIYSFDEIQQLLEKDEILLIYLENFTGNFIVRISGANNSVSILPTYRLHDNLDMFNTTKLDIYYLSDDELRNAVILDIKEKLYNKKNSNFLDNYHESKYFIRQILTPFISEFNRDQKILFMTNIKNNFVPLSVFPSPISEFTSDKKYVVDDLIISNLISLESLENRKSKRIEFKNRKNMSFLGIADPVLNSEKSEQVFALSNIDKFINIFRNSNIVDRSLFSQLEELPDTGNEVKNAFKNFDKNTSKLLLRENASESNLKSIDLSNFDVITFATHAVPVSKNSIYDEPGLILSIPNESSELDDGYLTPNEISKLNLNAELVILSACNTASGNKQDNQILSGLAQAFLYAGAKSVIVSNWIVENRATTLLMNEFYNNWLINNMPIPEALSKAKIYLRDNYDMYEHPAFWGAFTYYGH